MKRPVVPALALAVLTLSVAAALAASKPEKNAVGQTVQAANAPAVVDSLGLLERAVGRDSSKFDNLYRLGVMLLDRDRGQEAVRVLTKAHVIKPAEFKTLVNLGAAHDGLGNSDIAQGYYREALKAAPGDSVASCRLATSLYAAGKTAEAMGLLRDVIQKKPSSYCAYFALGVAFADAGIYRDAIRMWRKVVDLAPSSPEAISATESIEVLERYVRSTQ